MQLLIDPPEGGVDQHETVHFPWAHVEDFRRFFGLDRLLEYTRKQSNNTSTILSRLLGLRVNNQHIAARLSNLSAFTIASAQFAETMFEVRGELASYRNLDSAIRSTHPELAHAQRRRALAEYLYENKIIDELDLDSPMRTNRFLGIIAHHAGDFWKGEHEDLFDLVTPLQSAAQIRFAASALLAAVPERGISAEQTLRFASIFTNWLPEIRRVIGDRKSALNDNPGSVFMRASLQEIQDALGVTIPV